MRIVKREASNTLLSTTLWTVKPDSIAGEFLISVTVPNGDAPKTGWPALMATDGNGCVGTIHQAATYLAMSQEIPPSVAVTIGYPLDNDPPYLVARNRDLTPVAWPEWDEPYGVILGLRCPPSGGAAAFLSFINDELKPEIERSFNIDTEQWTLIGHSLGGLFATYALLSDPARFRRYLAFGSSYWWKTPLMFEGAEAFAHSGRARDIAVYLAAGDHDTRELAFKQFGGAVETPAWRHYLDVMGGVPDIAADTEKMAAILAKHRGIRVRSQILTDETHSSAAFPAISQGLRWLFGASAAK